MTHKEIVVVGIGSNSNFGRSLMRGICRYANAHQKWLIYEDMKSTNESFFHWPACKGVITSISSPHLLRCIRARHKFVVNCSANTDERDSCLVNADSELIGKAAAEHLIECRLQNFAFCGWKDQRLADRRAAGFKQALEAKGFTCDTLFVSEHLKSLGALSAANEGHFRAWLHGLSKPVGIMGTDDLLARNLAAACRETGLSVPEQVALIGVNNDELHCETCSPPLSSVDPNSEQVGYMAARQLDRLLKGEEVLDEEHVLYLEPRGVVRRMSTDVLAVSDVYLSEVMRFIREHACDPCTLGDVLKHVPVNRRWLERQFLATFRRTPHEEIIRVRIAKAEQLLLRTDESIEDIALSCGYSASQNFSKIFRRNKRLTPAAFRRNHGVTSNVAHSEKASKRSRVLKA